MFLLWGGWNVRIIMVAFKRFQELFLFLCHFEFEFKLCIRHTHILHYFIFLNKLFYSISYNLLFYRHSPEWKVEKWWTMIRNLSTIMLLPYFFKYLIIPIWNSHGLLPSIDMMCYRSFTISTKIFTLAWNEYQTHILHTREDDQFLLEMLFFIFNSDDLFTHEWP